MNCRHIGSLALLLTAAASAPAAAQSISLNFSENAGNQAFTQSVPIGPLAVNSANWNNTNDVGATAAGSMFDLRDDSGANTGASVTWDSSNVWYNSDRTADDEHRMSVGYLDDGDGAIDDGIGVSVTFSNIPYSTYRVYGLLGSDQGNEYNTVDFTVNGVEVFGAATTAPAFGNINTSLAQGNAYWTLANGTNRGNYWTLDSSGATLTITGFERSGSNRGSLNAVIIRDLSTPVFDLALKAIVNRSTGQVTVTNNTGAAVSLAGLGLLSTDGAWTPANWTSISTNYDQGGSVSADTWIEFARSAADLSEGTLGTGTLAQGQTINMGAIWSKYPKEGTDLRLEYLNASTGETILGLVEFTGNGGNPFAVGDFNGDGVINAVDWPTVRNNFNATHVGLLPAQSYKLGDMNADLLTNLDDLLQFKAAFDAVNGVGAFAAMAGAVPEPGSLALLAIGAAVLVGRRRVSKAVAKAAPLLAAIVLLAVASTASAQSGIGVSFRGGQGTDDTDPATSGANVTGAAGVVFSQSNWNNVGGNNPATDHDATVAGLLNSAGANSGASVAWSTDETWASTANGQIGDPAGNQDRNLVDGYIDAISTQPTVTATLSNIPYSAYDVYVYVGSDGDDRTGRVRINNSITSDRWFRTSTATATFTSAANYIQATAKTEATSVLSNYVVYQDVIGATLNVGVTRGTNNVGLHAVQIVQETNPQVLRLEVNTTTGLTRILNPTAAPIRLDFFEVTSPSAALDQAGWTPLGTGTNNGSNWEALGGLSDSILAQFFLNGQGTIGAGQALSLGSAYDGVAQDLAFRYNDPDSLTRVGLVSYVSGGQPGDFDGDTDVDGNDFLVWQRGLGTSYTQADLAIWKANFGATSSAATAAVPEPASLVLFAAAIGGAALCSRRRKKGSPMSQPTQRRIVMSSLSAAIALCVAASAMAAVTNDRDYRLGEGGPGENGSPGAVVGSGHSIAGAGDTLDQTGPSGAYLDLNQSGSPVYLNVFSGPKARPGVPAGSLGVQFDGVDDVLSGTRLSRPDELASLVGGSYPFNYTGITVRGLQGWVYPDQAGLNAGAFQSIVFDGIYAGGPAISASGKWTQSNSQHVDGADGVATIPGTVSVVGNTWSHVMHHNYPRAGGADNFRSVLYVNGIAVSANDDTVPTGKPTTFVSVLAVGAAEIANDGANPAFANFFRGAVDNLEMYVAGNNSAQGGQNYGTFDLFADNDWIANRIATTVPGGVLKPGDVNRDGAVNGTGTGPVASDDISAFLAGWRDRKTFQGAHNTLTAGDWETWGWGDMDHDGAVGFSDWYILRANHPTPANLNLAALLAAVPEPNSALLATMGLLAAGLARSRRRTRE